MDGKGLKSLFDFQKFQNNSDLEKIISETENRYKASSPFVVSMEMSDDELEMLNAAGVPGVTGVRKKPD